MWCGVCCALFSKTCHFSSFVSGLLSKPRARVSIRFAGSPRSLPPNSRTRTSHTQTMADTLHVPPPSPRSTSLHRLSVRLAATLHRISTSGAVTPEDALTPGSRRLLSVRTSEWARDAALHKRAEHGQVCLWDDFVGGGRRREIGRPRDVTSTSAWFPSTPPPTSSTFRSASPSSSRGKPWASSMATSARPPCTRWRRCSKTMRRRRRGPTCWARCRSLSGG